MVFLEAAMNGPSRGVIKRIYRPLGVGIIDSEEGDIIFTPESVRGRREGFDNLSEGRPVNYRKYPSNIGDSAFADDVWPD